MQLLETETPLLVAASFSRYWFRLDGQDLGFH